MRAGRILLASVCGLLVTAIVQHFAVDAVWFLADKVTTSDAQNWHILFAVITAPGTLVAAIVAAGSRSRPGPDRQPSHD